MSTTPLSKTFRLIVRETLCAGQRNIYVRVENKREFAVPKLHAQLIDEICITSDPVWFSVFSVQHLNSCIEFRCACMFVRTLVDTDFDPRSIAIGVDGSM